VCVLYMCVHTCVCVHTACMRVRMLVHVRAYLHACVCAHVRGNNLEQGLASMMSLFLTADVIRETQRTLVIGCRGSATGESTAFLQRSCSEAEP
jgi:hypothetical protein